MERNSSIAPFRRIVARKFLTHARLDELGRMSRESRIPLEELLLREGVPKHEVLFCLAARYHAPFVEFDESVVASYFLTFRLDMEHLKKGLWFPLSVREGHAEVIAHRPDDPAVVEDIKKTLGVSSLSFRVALPSDIIRIIEHNFDVNPRFAGCGGRTPLARVRTFLAYRRSAYAHYRTLYAKGRTGLAFIRTGVAFIVIALLFLRVLGAGWYLVPEAPLLVAGLVMVVDGVKWYLPARKIAGKRVDPTRTEPTWGTCVLDADISGGSPAFRRTTETEGADRLREDWEDLSPVMRRRFLASDRTDMAEDRTSLSGHRTRLARARTGLAFTRTGIAFAGLGIGLLRQFPAGAWTLLDGALIVIGALMSAEGLFWYLGGRRSGIEGLRSVMDVIDKTSIWDLVFPLRHHRAGTAKERPDPPVDGAQLPGIWATTGLALERTVLADRRGVMARVRTAMAVARTGMAFVRTGVSIASVGAGLLVYFGTASAGWTVFNVSLVVSGLALIVDGYRWIVPAERIRKEYPYCYGGMELTVPDYGKPNRTWGTVLFDHEEA